MRVGGICLRDRAPDLRRLSARRLRVSRYAERRFQSTRPDRACASGTAKLAQPHVEGELAGLPGHSSGRNGTARRPPSAMDCAGTSACFRSP